MNYGAFQQAIQNQVKAALSYDGSKVIWSDQTLDRPARPFVELSVLSFRDLSHHSMHGVIDNPDSDGDDGEEILLQTTDHLELTVQTRIFSAAVVGDLAPMNLAQKIHSFFGRETTNDALQDIAIVSRENVQNASLVLETKYEGRAIFNIIFRVAVVDTEATTYIETAPVETTFTGALTGDIESAFDIDLSE